MSFRKAEGGDVDERNDVTTNLDTMTSSGESEGSSTSHPHSAPTLKRFQTVLKDEEAYQAAQYLTPNDIPGCMKLL
jgi:hypothetical protein